MKRIQGVLAAVFFLSTTAALAQPGAFERRQESKEEIKQARADRWDLKKLELLRDRFDSARARNNRLMLKQLDVELAQYLDKELREAKRETVDAKGERRDTVRDAKGYRADRRDVRDARAEVRVESKELKRIRAIDREFSGLYKRYDPLSLAKKSRLMNELVQLAKVEIARDYDELRDRRR